MLFKVCTDSRNLLKCVNQVTPLYTLYGLRSNSRLVYETLCKRDCGALRHGVDAGSFYADGWMCCGTLPDPIS